MSKESPARQRLLDAMLHTIWERSYSASSVDRICESADVRKGSFYHFFKSKTALAIAALDHLWETESKPNLERIFDKTHEPLQRFENLLEYWYSRVIECRDTKGQVLGCPYFNIGTEAAASEPELTAKACEILDACESYIKEALKDAVDKKLVTIDDPAETASSLFAMIEGCSTQARIHNDPERIRHFSEAFSRVIGAELHPNLESPALHG